MPGGDGTGPGGMGPMTGRGAGYCAGYDVPGYANPAFGRGMGMGWGRGRGWFGGGRGRGRRNMYYATGQPGWARYGWAPAWGAPPPAAYGPAAGYGPYAAPPTPEQETEFLKGQAEQLQQQMDAISQRIAELEEQK